MLKILKYLKAIASLIGAVGTALLALYTDNETLTIIVAVATAVTTWAVPNIDVAEAEEQSPPVEDSLIFGDSDAVEEADYDYGIVYADATEPDVGDLPTDTPHGGGDDNR